MAERDKKVLFYWVPIIVYCLIIFIQSSYPSPATVPDLPSFDKLLHFAAYAVLGALFLRAFEKTAYFKNNMLLLLIMSILASSLYGMSDELHQHFVPSRDADIMDALADILGSICGVLLFQQYNRSAID